MPNGRCRGRVHVHLEAHASLFSKLLRMATNGVLQVAVVRTPVIVGLRILPQVADRAGQILGSHLEPIRQPLLAGGDRSRLERQSDAEQRLNDLVVKVIEMPPGAGPPRATNHRDAARGPRLAAIWVRRIRLDHCGNVGHTRAPVQCRPSRFAGAVRAWQVLD